MKNKKSWWELRMQTGLSYVPLLNCRRWADLLVQFCIEWTDKGNTKLLFYPTGWRSVNKLSMFRENGKLLQQIYLWTENLSSWSSKHWITSSKIAKNGNCPYLCWARCRMLEKNWEIRYLNNMKIYLSVLHKVFIHEKPQSKAFAWCPLRRLWI